MKKTQKQTVEIETISLGRRGYITMSRAQFEKISRLVETDVLLAYFERFESMLENNMKMGMPAPHSHYKTIRKWIESDLL